jgi:hypothetical protein
MTADFFVFGHFDQKKKNERWNELDIWQIIDTHSIL